MAAIYDFRDFSQIYYEPWNVVPDDIDAMAKNIAHERKHSVVVENQDDIYRITPKGKRWRMPDWFMIGTLGGKP